MTDMHVTQSDIDRANAFWTDQTRKIMGEVEGKTAASDDGPLEENTLVQAFARHRTNAVEELVDALELAVDLLTCTEIEGAAKKARVKGYTPDVRELKALLASYRGEQS